MSKSQTRNFAARFSSRPSRAVGVHASACSRATGRSIFRRRLAQNKYNPSAKGGYVIYLPASGRIEGKTIKTFNHPLYLIVEYKFRSQIDSKPKRKKFSIPLGKGARSISIELK